MKVESQIYQLENILKKIEFGSKFETIDGEVTVNRSGNNVGYRLPRHLNRI